MSTPANALDITQAGLVKFDGSTTFTGITTTNHATLVGAASNGITSVGPTATAGQVLRSGGASADPAYSTATYPDTAGASGNILTSNGTNFVSSPPATSGTVTSVSGTANQVAVATGTTTPVISLVGPYTPATYTAHGVLIGEGTSSIAALAAGSAGQILQSGGASADPTYSTATYPATAGSSGNILTSDGTNFVSSPPATSGTVTSVSGTTNQVSVANGTTTPVISLVGPYTPATFTAHGVLIGEGTSGIAALAAGSAGQILRSGGASADPAYSTATYPATAGTSGKVLISDGTNIVSSTPTFPNASATSGKFIRSDGTNWIASTPTLPTTAGTSGKILISDGTNFVSSTPTYPNASGTANNVLASDGTNFVSTKPAMVFIASNTISGAPSSIAFTSGLTTYARVLVIVSGIQPASNQVDFNMDFSTNGGSTYLNSGYSAGLNWNATNSTTLNNVNSSTTGVIGSPINNAASYNAAIWLNNVGIGQSIYWHGTSNWYNGNGPVITFCLLGGQQTATTINAIRFSFSAGNFNNQGTIALYGMAV